MDVSKVNRSLSRVFFAAVLGSSIVGGVYGIKENADNLLFVAARSGISPAVTLLSWSGANVRPDNPEDDPLWRAAARGHFFTVKTLLDSGADIHAGDDLALRAAAEFGRTEIVRLLLDHRANVHARDDEALMWAASNGHVTTVEHLLDRGANVHANNDDALRWASYHGHTEIVRMLLARGANPHAERDEAIRLAQMKGHGQTEKVLRTFMTLQHLKQNTNQHELRTNP